MNHFKSFLLTAIAALAFLFSASMLATDCELCDSGGTRRDSEPFGDPLMDDIIRQFEQKNIEVRRPSNLNYLQIDPDEYSSKKLKRFFSPSLWTTKSKIVKDGTILWIKEDGNHYFIEGGDDVQYLPVSTSSKVISVIDKRSLMKGGGYIFGSNQLRVIPRGHIGIGSGKFVDKIFIALPGIHLLSNDEDLPLKTDLSAVVMPSGQFSCHEITKIFKIINIQNDKDLSQCVTKGALVQNRDGTFALLKPGCYVYDYQSCPSHIKLDLKEINHFTSNSIGFHPLISLKFHFSLSVPKEFENYAEYLLKLSDQNSPTGLKFIATSIQQKIEHLVQQKNLNVEYNNEKYLGAAINALESEIQQFIKKESEFLIKSTGLSLAYLHLEVDRKKLLERQSEINTALHKQDLYKIERTQKQEEAEHKNLDVKIQSISVVPNDKKKDGDS